MARRRFVGMQSGNQTSGSAGRAPHWGLLVVVDRHTEMPRFGSSSRISTALEAEIAYQDHTCLLWRALYGSRNTSKCGMRISSKLN